MAAASPSNCVFIEFGTWFLFIGLDKVGTYDAR